jgi:hypothetical protein
MTHQYNSKRKSGSQGPTLIPGFRFVVFLKRIVDTILRGACDGMLLPVQSALGFKSFSALTGCRSISTQSASLNGGLHALSSQ